jgi:hypothetical protein
MYQQEVTLPQGRIDRLAGELCASGWHEKLTFQVKANRDAVYQLAKKHGASMKRSSTPNQIVDPRYTVEGSHLADRGLANDTICANLYHLERIA